MTSPTLKACPFCGGKNVSAGEFMGKNIGDGREQHYKQTACLDCWAAGPEVPFDDEDSDELFDDTGCNEAWNARPALPADEVRRIAELFDEAVEAAKTLGGADAKKGFGCYTEDDSRLVRSMYESISRKRAAIREALGNADKGREGV